MKYKQALTVLEHKHENKFVLKGSEPYLKKEFISRVKEIYPEYKIFFPEDQTEAINLLGSGSFFESPAIIFIRFNEMELQYFEELIKLYDSCIVASLTDKADVKSRSMTKIISDMKIVECNKLREYGIEYPLWISSKISEAGFKTPEKIDEIIFSRIGPNMSIIAHELEKLFLVKTDKTITEEDIKNYMSQTAISSAYDIFENLLRKNIKEALRCFYSYTRNRSTFIDIIAFLGVYFEKMYRLLLLREKKFEVNDIAEIVGIPAFLVRTKYMPRAIAFGKNKIASKINEVYDLDVRLRLFKGDKKILLEKFILDFI